VTFFYADLGRIEDAPTASSCYLEYGAPASAGIVANSFEINWSAGTFRTTVSGTMSGANTATGTIRSIVLDQHPCGDRNWLAQLAACTWTAERLTIP
jgi:hypothetical protein